MRYGVQRGLCRAGAAQCIGCGLPAFPPIRVALLCGAPPGKVSREWACHAWREMRAAPVITGEPICACPRNVGIAPSAGTDTVLRMAGWQCMDDSVEATRQPTGLARANKTHGPIGRCATERAHTSYIALPRGLRDGGDVRDRLCRTEQARRATVRIGDRDRRCARRAGEGQPAPRYGRDARWAAQTPFKTRLNRSWRRSRPSGGRRPHPTGWQGAWCVCCGIVWRCRMGHRYQPGFL